MIRKLISRVAIPLAIVAGIVGVAAPAMAYQPNGQYVCAGPGTGKCVDHHTPGGLGTVLHSATSTDMKLTWEGADGGCANGTVSAASQCPFTNGSGFNTTFDGDSIGCLHYANVGGYVQADGYVASGGSVTSACGDTGTFMVEKGSSFVNVYDTNQDYAMFGSLAVGQYMQSQSPGTALIFRPFNSGFANWGPCSSGCA